MAGFTKGEWKVWNLEDDDKGWTIQLGNDGRFIARTCDNTREDLANAHLIAASPRMIEFIQKLADSGNQEAKDFIQTLDLWLPLSYTLSRG